MIIGVKIKRLRENAMIPIYATEGSAAADIYAALDEPLIIHKGEKVLVPSGFAISVEKNDIVALVFGRSGLGTKHGITLANSVGVIDSDYRGEIYVSLINNGDRDYKIQPNERIAQIMFVPICQAEFVESKELDETVRGFSGFGSTGRT